MLFSFGILRRVGVWREANLVHYNHGGPLRGLCLFV